MHLAVPFLNEKIQKFTADLRASQHDLYVDSSIGESPSPDRTKVHHILQDEFTHSSKTHAVQHDSEHPGDEFKAGAGKCCRFYCCVPLANKFVILRKNLSSQAKSRGPAFRLHDLRKHSAHRA